MKASSVQVHRRDEEYFVEPRLGKPSYGLEVDHSWGIFRICS